MNKEERVIELINQLENTFEIRTFLDHDPYKVYSSKYMKWGDQLENIEVADYQGLDGFTYTMTGWESHPSTVPEQFSLDIHGNSERVAVQYTLTYNILWQDLGQSEVRTYETRQVYAGAELPNVDPVAPSGWHWGGVWKTAGQWLTMPWADYSVQGTMYSDAYIATFHPVIPGVGVHTINWLSKVYDAAGNVHPTQKHVLHTDVLETGQTIVEPGSFTYPDFPDWYDFIGWETHPAKMPDEDLEIYAVWQLKDFDCKITWILRLCLCWLD